MRAPRLLLRLMSKTLALVALFVVFTAGTAAAQDVCYVDTGGDDAFNGLAAAFDGTNGPNRTINACLGEAFVGDGDIISVEAGDYNEAIDVTEDLIFEARQTGAFTVVNIDDGVTINNDVTFRANSLGGASGTFLIGAGNLAGALDIDDGSLTIDADGRLVVAAGGTTTRDDDTSVSGNVTYAGLVNLIYTDDNASNTNVQAQGEFPASLANGDLTVNLGGNNTLTFGSVTGISDLAVGAATELVGIVVINSTILITGPGNVGSLDYNAGNLNILSNVAANNVDIASGTGIFDLNGWTLTDEGDFIRLGGTFTPDGGVLAFIGDDTNNTFAPGPNFAVGAVTVDKDGQTLTITEDLDVTNNGIVVFGVAANTTVDIGSEQVNVVGTGITDVDGTIVDLANGGVVFTGQGTLRGDGTYGNIFVAVGAGNNVNVDGAAGAEEDVLFAGILTLTSGGIVVADATDDLSPLDGASVLVNVAGAGNVAGSFNAVNNSYDLTYNGEIPGVLYTGGTEFDPAGANEDGVNNVVFTTTGGTVDLSAQGGGTVGGVFTLTGVTAGNAFTVLIGDGGGSLQINGALTVGQNSVLDGSVPGDTDVTLAGPSNSVLGVVTTDIDLLLNNGVTLNGTTDTAFLSLVGDVTVAANAMATINNIQEIVGNLLTNAGSTLNLTLADEQDVTGDLTANGSSLVLGSLVDVGGDVALDNVAFNFQGNNLLVAGDFSGTGDVTYMASGGRLVHDTAAKLFGTNGVSIPNVSVSGVAATLSSNSVIGNSLIETGAGLLDQGGFTLTLNNDVTTDGGIFIDNTGAAALLSFNSTTLTMSADATIKTPFTIANGQTLTLASNNATERNLTVDDGPLTIDGTLALGAQDLTIVDGNDLWNATGAVTAGPTGILILEGGLVGTPNNIEVNGNQLDIPNLSIVGVSLLGAGSNGNLRITNNLILNNTLTENDVNDALLISDMGTITVNSVNPLAGADPTFQGLVSLIYNTVGQTTGNEVPDAGALQDLTINVSTITFDQDASVAGTLTLAGALATTSVDEIITLLDGSRLTLQVDNANLPPAGRIVAAGGYTLEYAGPSDVTSNAEFGLGGTVTLLVINPGGADVITLDQARTVNDVNFTSGALNFGGFNFTTNGDVLFNGGGIAGGGGNPDFVFGGTNSVSLTVPAGGLDLDAAAVDLRLNKTDAVDQVVLGGGNLIFLTAGAGPGTGTDLILTNGLLVTGANVAVLDHSATGGGQPDQGFTKNNAAGQESHVVGNVRKRVDVTYAPGLQAYSNITFPVGTDEDNPLYRPLTEYITSMPSSTVNLTASHVNASPGGTNGIPFEVPGVGLVGNYPPFYWTLTSDVTQSPQYQNDMSLDGEGYTTFPEDNVEDIRIIRRFQNNLNNPWVLQGGTYDNALEADGDPLITVRGATGNLSSQGVIFTYAQINQPPVFTTPLADVTLAEGTTVTLNVAATDTDINDSATLSVVGELPSFATFDPGTGDLVLTPGFDDAGTYTVTIRATDVNGEFDETTATITVTNANRPPDVTTVPEDLTGLTASDGNPLTITFTATDEDNEAVTFTIDPADVEGVAFENGVFTFTPTFDQVGTTFSFTVTATDESGGTTDVAFDVEVVADLLYGDANLSGNVSALDASVVLQHAAGMTTLTGKAFVQADVSGNGTVTAFDAALILQWVAGIITEFPVEVGGKAGLVATGDPAWGEVSFDDVQKLINVPITLAGDVSNVYAIQFTANVDVALVNFKQVAGALPKDWQISYSFNKEAGELKIAAAGTTPLKDASVIATATFEQLDPISKPVFRAEGFVNENASVALAELVAEQLPKEFSLSDNYPNPFNPSTTITFALPQKAKVELEVYDVAGRLVQTLVNQEKDAGRYTIQWDGRNAAGSQVASGLYVYRIKAGSFVEAKTMLLVK